MSGLLTLDMGNSGLKAAVFKEDRITSRERFGRSPYAESLEGLLKRHRPDGISVCSVVPEWSGVFIEEMKRRGVRDYLMAGPDTEYPFKVNVENPSAVGTDRLCAAAGALSLGVEEAVVVDIGTAVTVDTLSSRGFEGGAIFPGPRALIRSLGENTSALPQLEWTEGPLFLPGKSTFEAVRAGVGLGLAAAVSGLVKRSVKSFDKAVPVLLTGGGAGIIEEYLDLPFRPCPDLVFRGLRLLYFKR